MHDYLGREVGMVEGGSGKVEGGSGKVERGVWKFRSEREHCAVNGGGWIFFIYGSAIERKKGGGRRGG